MPSSPASLLMALLSTSSLPEKKCTKVKIRFFLNSAKSAEDVNASDTLSGSQALVFTPSLLRLCRCHRVSHRYRIGLSRHMASGITSEVISPYFRGGFLTTAAEHHRFSCRQHKPQLDQHALNSK